MRLMGMAALLAAAPALAQEPAKLREFCGDRPGLGTPACTVDKGHLQVEFGIVDWTDDKERETREDIVQAGQVALRYGVTDGTEFRLGWTAYGHDRVRDRRTNEIERTHGVGDVTVGVKQNLASPDGDGFSIALLPYATLPVGRQGIGAGTWGAGLIVPVSYDLSDALNLELTPQAAAMPDLDGDGRHLAYGGVVGLQAKLSKALSVTGEFEALRDRDPDPEQRATRLLAGLSFAYLAKEQLQFDAGVNAGLNRRTPGVELYLGVSEKF